MVVVTAVMMIHNVDACVHGGGDDDDGGGDGGAVDDDDDIK